MLDLSKAVNAVSYGVIEPFYRVAKYLIIINHLLLNVYWADPVAVKSADVDKSYLFSRCLAPLYLCSKWVLSQLGRKTCA